MISIKLQSNFIEITLWHGYSPVNLLHIFRTPFPNNVPKGQFLYNDTIQFHPFHANFPFLYLLFFKNWKKYTHFKKNTLIVSIWVKRLIWNTILRAFRRKNSKNFTSEVFLCYVVGRMIIEVPSFQEALPELKTFWLHVCTCKAYFWILSVLPGNASQGCILLFSVYCFTEFSKDTDSTKLYFRFNWKRIFDYLL